jgi:hypothetical protein
VGDTISAATTAFVQPAAGDTVDAQGRVIGSAVSASVYASTATQTFADNTEAAITFDTVISDPAGLWSNTNPTRLTAKTPGRYLIVGSIIFNNIGAGRSFAGIWKNGTTTGTLLAEQGAVVSAGYPSWTVCAVAQLAAGDYVELSALPNSGSGQHLLTASTPVNQLSLSRILD